MISTTTDSELQYGPNHDGGAYQYKAPELFDHEPFGFADTRPTPATDIYSFSLVCIEVKRISQSAV